MEPVAGYVVVGIDSALGSAAPVVEGFVLTARELEVLTLLCGAQTDKQIARQLVVSPKTVSTFLEHIYLKLGVCGDVQNKRCAAMLAAFDLGLVAVPPRH